MNNDQNLPDIEQAQRDQRDLLNEVKREVNTFLPSLEVGDLVDALDSNNTWRMTRIIAKDDKYIEFEFTGWEEKWNERVLLQGAKIRPFRSETTTDTSSSKGAFRGKEKILISEIAKVRSGSPDSGDHQ